jgi:DNA-binding transcriptional LysR family regulator
LRNGLAGFRGNFIEYVDDPIKVFIINGRRKPCRFESNFGELLRDAAIAGLGIAQHSTWHVCDDLRTGRLRVVLPGYPIADTGIHAVMPRRQLVPLRVRAFIDFLSGRFGEKPPWDRGLRIR